ncbi:MAG: hypothetical protein GWP19_13115 [Planctomycetia bacterium]|nr:hypothetical protein [Planctomycetia bacterium]
MKLRKILTVLWLSTFVLQAQDITNKLGGNTVNDTYDVTDSNDNILFRVRGDGSVSIGNPPMWYKLNVDGTLKTTEFIMTTGATDGEVLKTDANGNASWQPDIDIGAWFTSRLYVVSQTISVPTKNIKTETLSCNDATDLALSAGWDFPGVLFNVSSLKPVGSDSYYFIIYNDFDTAQDVTIYCKCLQID